MNEKFIPKFEGGATDPKRKVIPFGKRGAEKISSIKKETPEVKFARFLDEKVSTGDPELDEMRSDYIALQAFNEVAGVYNDTMETERVKKQIMDKLNGKKAA